MRTRRVLVAALLGSILTAGTASAQPSPPPDPNDGKILTEETHGPLYAVTSDLRGQVNTGTVLRIEPADSR